MPISHLMISTADIAAATKFYTAALAPLGYKPAMEFNDGKVVGYSDGRPNFWIQQVDDASKRGNLHYAFEAKSEDQVKAFHEAAIAAGGKDNGAPGPRVHYSPTYYGAFVHDVDGNNIEVVFSSPTPYQS